ncbi:toll-like receptor 4 [Saccostrea echinata]|uniref:toll-like receptor 4 n=1 Tax=Saccostrea echinata TaxID=191078 RepID=UPI002A81EF7A|nr:toll-like receptor 4 [Saccostrea echinata]
MGAFEGLHFLEHLDISNNDQLTLDGIPNVTNRINPEIQLLNFEKLHCISGIIRVLKIKHVKYLNFTHLKTLNLASNRIAYFERGVTQLLPITLKNLNVGNNLLIKGIYILQLNRLNELETLNISYQNQAYHSFADIMSSCTEELVQRISTCENQSESNLKAMQIETDEKYSKRSWYDGFNFTFYLPPKLRVLYIHHTQYTFPIDLPVIVNTSITHIYAYNNLFIKILYPVYNLDKLEYVDLSQNLLTNLSGIRKTDCTSLKYLNLSYNMLGDSLEDKSSSEIFSHFDSLEVLDLSTNRLTGLAPNIFTSLTNIKHLNVSFNKIDEWVVGMRHMKHLVSVDLSNNDLSALNKKTMADLQSLASLNKTISVNLLGNPLMCTCNNMRFLTWLSRSVSLGLQFIHLEEYRCVLSNSSSTKIGNITIFVHQMKVECTEYQFIIVGCSFLILVFFGITAWKILRRYQWTLRYWYYVSRGTPQHYKNKGIFHFRYDAFLSYDEEDHQIALLVANKLETNKHLKLCIPERDFMPGTNIADNIINAIHISRKFFCIISTNYVNSQWSMFEFQMGQIDAIHSKLRQEKNIFIVLLLKDTLSIEALNPAVLAVLETDSCVTYTSGRDSELLCFEKLDEMLCLNK